MGKEAPRNFNNVNQKNDIDLKLTRRQFLGAVGALLFTKTMPDFTVSAQTPEGQNPLSIKQINPAKEQKTQSQINENTKKEPSLTGTALESVVFTAGNYVFSKKTAKALGVSLNPESKSLAEMVREEPVSYLIECLVKAPAWEEFMFRFIPNLLIFNDKSNKIHLDIGIPSSLLFAYAHNENDSENAGKYKFEKDKVPLPEFNGGLYRWYLIRKRGFTHAVAAHSIANATYMGIEQVEKIKK